MLPVNGRKVEVAICPSFPLPYDSQIALATMHGDDRTLSHCRGAVGTEVLLVSQCDAGHCGQAALQVDWQA
jgi:hypothetical protein